MAALDARDVSGAQSGVRPMAGRSSGVDGFQRRALRAGGDGARTHPIELRRARRVSLIRAVFERSSAIERARTLGIEAHLASMQPVEIADWICEPFEVDVSFFCPDETHAVLFRTMVL